MPLTEGATQFAELNDVLGRLVEGARRALGDNFVGTYLVGSFALGDADIHSDCDFIVATGGPAHPAQEAIRRLHESFPTEDGHWNRHLEGSYAPIDDLRRLDALGRDWLFIDHGHAEMEWSAHCNSPEHRRDDPERCRAWTCTSEKWPSDGGSGNAGAPSTAA
ncbi:MAG: nucleotidyltransferase domain-containing protein [Actinomycetota bacterium]|nr:nucleotidyltransferase domain-containing protein [Actinomycetota bacterium]